MPKKVFKIAGFNKGIIGNASPRDIPEDAMSYGENVDSRTIGRVEGIKSNEAANATYDARVMAPIIGENNELLGQDSSKQFKAYDIDGDSITSVGSPTSDFAASIVPLNEEAYVGMTTSFRGGTPSTPKWVGRANNPPFSVANAGDYVVEDSECKSFADSQNFDTSTSPLITLGSMPGSSESAILGGSSGAFEDGRRYFWAISLIYDGFQESPLITGEADGDLWFQDATSDTGYADLMIRLAWNTGDLPARVTGINVYRAESPEQGTGPTSEYSLIKSVDDLSTGSSSTYVDMGVTLTEEVDTMETGIDVSDGSIFADGDTIKVGSETKSVSSVSGNTLTISSPFSNTHSIGDSVLINTGRWAIGSDVGFPGSGAFNNQYFFRFRDDGSSGATYEDNSGVPETMESSSVDYRLSASFGPYLFMGDSSKSGVPDAEKYIFRSAPNAYSVVDWSSDYLALPERPTALAGFNGMVYVFSETNMYRINPVGMYLEDTFRGVGALNENMVVTTNFGMFHADENNIYINDGRTSRTIGDPILTVQEDTSVGWLNLNKTDTSDEHYASMQFDPVNKRLLVFVESTGTTTVCWAYDVQKERWDLYTSFDIPTTTAVGPAGTIYAVMGDTGGGFSLKTLFTSSTRKNWKVRSKDFDFGSDTGYVWLYDIHAYGGGALDIDYYVDGSSSNANPSVSTDDNPTGSDNIVRKATVSSGDKKSRSIKIEVASAATSDILDNITVQYRLPLINE